MESPGEVTEMDVDGSVAEKLSEKLEDDDSGPSFGTKCPVCGVQAIFVSHRSVPMCGPLQADDQLFHKHDNGYYFHNDEQEGIDVEKSDESDDNRQSRPQAYTHV